MSVRRGGSPIERWAPGSLVQIRTGIAKDVPVLSAEGNSTMVFMVAASTGFREAREIYTAGHKSSNKLHLDPNSLFAAGQLFDDVSLDFGTENGQLNLGYVDRLNSAALQLGGFRNRFEIPANHFLRDGKAMLRMRPVAANCGELAMMAAAGAWVRLGEPRPAPVALVSLAAPADHVFCVVGTQAQCARLHGHTIQELPLIPRTETMWAADPWLNVMCRLSDYPERAAAKFNKWQAENKRVAWGDGPQGEGWYPPVGDYSNGFDAAGMQVILG